MGCNGWPLLHCAWLGLPVLVPVAALVAWHVVQEWRR